MTALEKEIRKIIVEYGFVKRVPGYPFPCLVIPKPVMDTLCERLARFVQLSNICISDIEGLLKKEDTET